MQIAEARTIDGGGPSAPTRGAGATHEAPGPSTPAGLRAHEAQRTIDVVALQIAPAATGALIAYSHVESLGALLIFFVAMLGAAQLVERRPRLPLHLLPAVRVLVAIAAPAIGCLVAAGVLAAAAGGSAISIAQLEASVLGAWLVLGLSAWIKIRVEERARIRIAVVGPAEFAADLAGELEATRIRSREMVGWIGPAGEVPDLVQLGQLADVRDVVLDRGIDLLVCAPEWEHARGASGPSVLEWIADSCLDLPVRMQTANQLYEELFGHVPLGTAGVAWFQYIMHPRFRRTSPTSKRAFDLLLGGLMAVIALPVVAVAALAIRLIDRGPALYRQRRLGEHGRPFEIVKLRTMRTDAEADGPQWSLAGDDRVTQIGRLLRRTHIDELPQLWNVLRGEMTLVGPRPERPEMVAGLEQTFPRYSRRHLAKPGVTGWAAVRCGYAGSDEGSAWKLCHDLYYLKHCSLLGDLLILIETALEAFRDAHRALRTPAERFILDGADAVARRSPAG